MNQMFLDLYENEIDTKCRLILFELVMAEYYFYHLKSSEQFLNETLFRLRRFSEICEDHLMAVHGISKFNEKSQCNEYSLLDKINLLHKKEIINPSQKDVLHKIRIAGNDGIHKEVKLRPGEKFYSKNQLIDLFKMIYTELIPLFIIRDPENQPVIYSFEYKKMENSSLFKEIYNSIENHYSEKLKQIENNNALASEQMEKKISEIKNSKNHELKILEDLYNEELSQANNQLAVISSERDEMEKNFKNEIQNLNNEYNKKLKALNELYSHNNLKFKKEKMILDLQYKEKHHRLESNFKKAIHEKETIIEKQKKQLRNMKLLLAGVSSALAASIGSLIYNTFQKSHVPLKERIQPFLSKRRKNS